VFLSWRGLSLSGAYGDAALVPPLWIRLRDLDITCDCGTDNVHNDGTPSFQRINGKNSRGCRGRSSVVCWECIVAAVRRESVVPKVSAVQAMQRVERPR